MKTEDEVRDRMQAITAVLHDLQNRVLTCAIRGTVNKNMAAEVASKTRWVEKEFADLADSKQEVWGNG